MDSQTKDSLISKLENAFIENVKDPVTLITIIDLYAAQFNKEGSREDIVEYLTALYKLLKSNSDSIKEIGWDMPKILLDFFTPKNVDFDVKLTKNEIITNVIKCFNLISQLGNPKECLLIGCNLLASFSIDTINGEDDIRKSPDSCTPDNVDYTRLSIKNANKTEVIKSFDQLDDKQVIGDGKASNKPTSDQYEYIAKNKVEFIPNLKLHLIFQLLKETLNRIDTLYPSKFLGMVISSILSYLKANVKLIEDPSFLLHRVGELLVKYQPSIVPYNESLSISKEDYNKLVLDENAIVLKLVQEFLSIIISLSYKKIEPNFDKLYYYSLMGKNEYIKSLNNEMDNNFRLLCAEYRLLADKYQINVGEEFLKYLSEVEKIYEPFLNNITESKSETNQMLYLLSYTYNLKKSLDNKTLKLDSQGVVMLSAFYFINKEKDLISDINTQSLIYLYLACSTASIQSPVYDNKGLENVCRYWLWVCLTQKSIDLIRTQFKEIHPIIIKTFLQMFLLKTYSTFNKEIQKISLALFTRILCLIPENICYDFIFDTLLTCPYRSVKVTILKILKDLMTKSSTTIITLAEKSLVSPVTDGIQNISISNTSEPPKLPPRPYIPITDDRMASIHSLAMMAIENTTSELNFKKRDDILLTLSYMNFFVGLRDKWNRDLLHVINKEIDDRITKKISSIKKDDKVPELQFITLANDTLGRFLNNQTT
ncbi:Ybp2p PWA37_002166 [Arxiozyma heterogenica]|uniref:Uncharacterized protein n=1 Tax=Arxiozyma heterogenica TaxID=278026 RepID=A0AAN7ZSY2_9SACH|nr:hypothetical protein RI543_001629 [Kazachstania heterogenica]